jgi:hypothetical protein
MMWNINPHPLKAEGAAPKRLAAFRWGSAMMVKIGIVVIWRIYGY